MTNFPDYIFVNDSSVRFLTVDNIMRSDMESGVAKTKPINSIPVSQITFPVSINRNDLASFYRWFSSDLNYGQRWFLMRHPIFGEVQRFRFLETRIEWEKIGTLLVSDFVLEAYLDV